jgi:hypothetical protein
MKLPRPTASLHRQAARCLWQRAPSLPKAERLKALRNAELHAGLARALDANLVQRLVQGGHLDR